MDKVAECELVQRAKVGDVPAFEALYRQYNDRIYNFAKQVTGSAEDACDVAQETFIRAWDSLPRLRSDGTFGVWLHRIALNLSSDVLKKRGRQHAADLDGLQDGLGEPCHARLEGNAPNPERAVISTEVQDAVCRAVDSLSADHRLVVTMHHMEGMDVESIAGVLGVPRGTVMSRLSRAREILRRKLVPYVEKDQR